MSVATVRLLIPDNDSDNQVFEDYEIESFIDLEASLKESAALALETIASNEAMVSKKFSNQDLSTDGPAVAASLLARAKGLREQARAEREAEATAEAEFMIVPGARGI